MAPVRTYVTELHGQRVTVKVYPAPTAEPAPRQVRERQYNTAVRMGQPPGTDWTYRAEPKSKTGGATERGGRCRAPANAEDFCL